MYIIHEIKDSEYHLLDNFLYMAKFVPKGTLPLSKDFVINDPNNNIYIKDFGTKKDDFCLVASTNDKIIGAIWARIVNDLSHIDNFTPSICISLYKKYRKKGIGTELMKQMLSVLKNRDFKQVSLCVHKDNPAIKLYKNCDFKVFKEDGDKLMMVCKIS